MKHLHLIRKKLLPLFISAVVMASQIPVVAADFSDAEIEVGEDSTMQENTAEDWNQQSEESGETDTDIAELFLRAVRKTRKFPCKVLKQMIQPQK